MKDDFDDFISREEAIEAIKASPDCPNGYSDTYDKARIIGVLEELPPVKDVYRIVRDAETDTAKVMGTFKCGSVIPTVKLNEIETGISEALECATDFEFLL